MKRRIFVGSLASSLFAAGIPPAVFAKHDNGAVQAVTGDGKPVLLTRAEVNEFRDSLKGLLLLSNDTGYDQARRVWNAMIDRRPALIARCADATDVIQSVQFAKSHNLLVAVRAGGHSSSGKSMCDHGLVIDLSPMRAVTVDAVNETARVQAGALLGDFDRAAQRYGLATTTGTVSHTGVAGLTLGGGMGKLNRKYGLTIDNLLAVNVVAANGSALRASAQENSDLLWGLRGGGGNFGVATEFEFRLHKIGTTIGFGGAVFPMQHAARVMQFLAEYSPELSDEAGISPTFVATPNGEHILHLEFIHCGQLTDAVREFEPLLQVAKPIVQTPLAPQPYLTIQSDGDELQAHGQFGYIKSGFVRQLSLGLTQACISAIERARLPLAHVISLPHLGGAVARVKPEATAFFHRNAQHAVFLAANWRDPAHTPPFLEWARTSWKEIEPLTHGFYINMQSADDTEERVRESYGTNLERLVLLKNKYDPTNLFRLNANVRPTA